MALQRYPNGDQPLGPGMAVPREPGPLHPADSFTPAGDNSGPALSKPGKV